MIIEPIQYAPNYVKKIAAIQAPDAKAYAMFRMYDADPEKYPSLRDRTTEILPAVKAMAGSDHHAIVTMTGSDMHRQFGFDAVGAQFAQTFRLILS
jgi:hypothetical protein